MSLITQYFPSGGIKSNAIPDVGSGIQKKNTLISQYYPTVSKAPVEVVKESSFFEKVKDKLGGFVSGVGKFAVGVGVEAINLGSSTIDFAADFLSGQIEKNIRSKKYSAFGDQDTRNDLADRWKSFYDRTGGEKTEKAKAFTENLRSIDYLKPSEEWSKASTKDKLTKKLPETILNIGPGVVASLGSFALNPVLGFTVSVGSVADEIKGIAVENGVKPENAEKIGLGTGLLVGWLDKLVPDEIFSPAQKKQFVGSIAKKVVKTGLKEAGTEMVQEDVQLLVESTLREDLKMDEVVSRNLMAGLGGLLGGTGASTMVSFANNVRNGDIGGSPVKTVDQEGKEVVREQFVKPTVVENEVNLAPKENVVQRQSISVRDKYEGAKTALASIKPDGTGSIAIVLDEKAQGKGLGTKIVADLEGKLAERGITTMDIRSFPEAVGFWEKQGYKVSGEQSMNLVPMTKTIESKKVDVLDKNSVEPVGGKKVYHATNKQFDNFDISKAKTDMGGAKAIFFSETPEGTKYYQRGENSRVIETNISPEAKIFDYQNPEHTALLENFIQESSKNKPEWGDSLRRLIKSGDWGTIEGKDIQGVIKKLGFDGFYDMDMTGHRAIGITNPKVISPSPLGGKVETMPTSELSELKGSLKGRDEKPGGVERAMAEIKAGKSPAVRIRKVDGKTIIEDGGHRVEAYKRLGIKDVPVQDVTSEYEPKGTPLPAKTNEERLKLVKDEKSVRSTLKDIRKELNELKTQAEGMAIIAQEQRAGINTEDVAKLKRAMATSKTLQEGDIETIRKSKTGKLLNNVLQNIQEVHPELDEDAAFDFARNLPTKADENARTPTIIELEKKEKSLAKLLTQLKEKQKELSIKDSEALTDEWSKALAAQEDLINVIKVPSAQLPVGEGKVKVSRLEARTKDTLGEMSQEEIDRLGLTTYNQMNKKENITLASKYVAENTDQALRVIKGEIDPPAGILKNSIYVALKALGAENTDVALKVASLGSTRMGQEISILSEIDKDSPVSMMEDVVKTRIEAFERKTGRKSSAKIKNEVSKIDAEVKPPSGRQWDSFLKEILC